MFRRLGRKAQTTAEYAILIALVVGAIVAMQVYVRRGIQGRIKNAMDHTGVSDSVGNTTFNFTNEQYEPYYLSSDTQSSSARTQNELLGTGGVVGRSLGEQTIQAREQVMSWGSSDLATSQTVANATVPGRPALPDVPREYEE